MAHKIDNSKGFDSFIAANGAPAWHGLGTIKPGIITAEEALNEGGLNFIVLKMPNIHYWTPKGQAEPITIVSDSSFFTFRTDVNKVLGSKLGADYTVLQNIEALNVADEILQKGAGTIETAGAIDEGKKIFICIKLNSAIKINNTDEVKQYLLLTTSHDGSLSITALLTNIRVVCNNTLSAALKDATGAIKIRHTANAAQRMAQAVKILNVINDNTSINSDNYSKMAEKVISRSELMNYLGNVFMTEEEIKSMQEGKKFEDLNTRKQNIITEVLTFADNGRGQSQAMKGSNHTMWSAYNAVTGYATRNGYKSASARANSMLFGSTATMIKDAGNLALAPEKIKPLTKNNFLSGINFN